MQGNNSDSSLLVVPEFWQTILSVVALCYNLVYLFQFQHGQVRFLSVRKYISLSTILQEGRGEGTYIWVVESAELRNNTS